MPAIEGSDSGFCRMWANSGIDSRLRETHPAREMLLQTGCEVEQETIMVCLKENQSFMDSSLYTSITRHKDAFPHGPNNNPKTKQRFRVTPTFHALQHKKKRELY